MYNHIHRSVDQIIVLGEGAGSWSSQAAGLLNELDGSFDAGAIKENKNRKRKDGGQF